MPSMDMSSPIDRHYRRDVRLLFLVGLWPYQNLSDRILRSLIVNVTFIAGFVFHICQFYVSSFEMESSVKELQLFVLFLCCSMSYYNILLKFSNGRKIRDRIVFNWEQLSNEQELFIMKKYANESEQYTLTITIIFCTFASFLISPSLFHFILYVARLTNDSQLKFPLPARYFFHIEKHPYLLLILEYITILIICTLAIAIYSTFILFVTHACALLSLVTFKIDQSFKTISNEVPYDWSPSERYDAYKWIKEIVKRHKNAAEFIDMVNATSENLYFIQMGLGILLVIAEFFYLIQSIQMIQSIDFTQYVYELFMCGCYVGGSMFTVYLNCYIGQKLMDHGTEVQKSFNRVSLYELPPSCQKLLPLLIMRSTKPCVVSIGGMFVASHDFFARFMNTSLSYAMVCYNIR